MATMEFLHEERRFHIVFEDKPVKWPIAKKKKKKKPTKCTPTNN
jgi:hypothetical protein